MKCKLYLVRHGESLMNTHGTEPIKLPDHAIPLTPEGTKQANKVGDFLSSMLRFEGVQQDEVCLYTSPYLRAVRTAEIINMRLPYPDLTSVREHPMLAELDFGYFHGIPKEQVQKLFPSEYAYYQMVRTEKGKYFARRPGGESPMDCEVRQRLFIHEFIRHLDYGYAPAHVILVGHGAQINLLIRALARFSYQWYDDVPNPGNCSVQLVEVDTKARHTYHGYVYGDPEPENT